MSDRYKDLSRETIYAFVKEHFGCIHGSVDETAIQVPKFAYDAWLEEYWSAELQALEGHSNLVTSLAVSPCGQIALASPEKTVMLWDVMTGKERHVLEHHSDRVL
ncbi:WD40 repeat-like protein [Penicillium hordei]|uniref:WD40 repeat-like protein n=1 Tax=Penicillium hordei TaxID=40994 RepID=A0AAD6EBE1_9EURO|nr:WD40 repeat-like protein [Penicillium hordei]KAJ5607731.1 WD40 repeat-like protein [Penicillium hordei]